MKSRGARAPAEAARVLDRKRAFCPTEKRPVLTLFPTAGDAAQIEPAATASAPPAVRKNETVSRPCLAGFALSNGPWCEIAVPICSDTPARCVVAAPSRRVNPLHSIPFHGAGQAFVETRGWEKKPEFH